MARITVDITYARDDGVTVSRHVDVSQTPYGNREPVGKFKARARRAASGALTSVLGASPDLTVSK